LPHRQLGKLRNIAIYGVRRARPHVTFPYSVPRVGSSSCKYAKYAYQLHITIKTADKSTSICLQFELEYLTKTGAILFAQPVPTHSIIRQTAHVKTALDIMSVQNVRDSLQLSEWESQFLTTVAWLLNVLFLRDDAWPGIEHSCLCHGGDFFLCVDSSVG